MPFIVKLELPKDIDYGHGEKLRTLYSMLSRGGWRMLSGEQHTFFLELPGDIDALEAVADTLHDQIHIDETTSPVFSILLIAHISMTYHQSTILDEELEIKLSPDDAIFMQPKADSLFFDRARLLQRMENSLREYWPREYSPYENGED